jgi:hypothetical protein
MHSVNTQVIRETESIIRTQGVHLALRLLRWTEPQLASYLMEASSEIYGSLDAVCESQGRVKEIHDQMLVMTFVCIESLRASA